MFTIEREAMEALSRRRRSLCGVRPPTRGAPDAHWTDYDGVPTGPTYAAQLELDEIDAALTRIGTGRYGLCLACGGPIGMQRLRAIPEARYCVSCSSRRPARE
ncbi:MAG TPA: TraR/DksA C4-type zinc finger protein [Anaeromyxobacter sp.]|nr:TraR/DksA C4-type zinc finger protein [Anaeromyxobacter sp.]